MRIYQEILKKYHDIPPHASDFDFQIFREMRLFKADYLESSMYFKIVEYFSKKKEFRHIFLEIFRNKNHDIAVSQKHSMTPRSRNI